MSFPPPPPPPPPPSNPNDYIPPPPPPTPAVIPATNALSPSPASGVPPPPSPTPKPTVPPAAPAKKSSATGAVIGIIVAVVIAAVGVASFLYLQHKRHAPTQRPVPQVAEQNPPRDAPRIQPLDTKATPPPPQSDLNETTQPAQIEVNAPVSKTPTQNVSETTAAIAPTAPQPPPAEPTPTAQIPQTTIAPTPSVTATANVYPSALGSYVWVHERWQPLPRNHAHVIQNGSQVGNAFASGSETDSLNSAIRSGDKAAELMLDGDDPAPALESGTTIRLLYVGNDPSTIEIGPLTFKSNGTRVANLYPSSQGNLGFAASRVSAKVEKINDNMSIFTIDAPLPASRYVVFTGSDGYEFKVQ